MNYELLWTMDEYQSLLDYEENLYKYINIFINQELTDTEKQFDESLNKYLLNTAKFKKDIETIINLYKAIRKNDILNDNLEYGHQLLNVVRKNSHNTSYHTSSSTNLDTFFSFAHDIVSGNVSNGIESSDVSLDVLVSKMEQYRQNLIRLSEAIKKGEDLAKISEQILEFKKICFSYLKYQFNKIDIDLDKIEKQSINQEKLKIEENSIVREVHIGNTGRMFSIKNSKGIEKYYFKPAETKNRVASPYRAYIQEAACNVQQIVNPSRTVKCNVCIVNGKLGAIQEKIAIDKEATKQFYRYFYGRGGKLDSELLRQILDEYLVDYCLCNYDAHANNFIIDVNGNLRGIDKEQSFRYIYDDENDDMFFSHNYNEGYGESETIYATILKKMLTGEIDSQVLDVLDYHAARLEQIPDSKYREIFKKYAYSQAKDLKAAQMLLDRIVNRKKSIINKVNMLKQVINNETYSKENNEDIFNKHTNRRY